MDRNLWVYVSMNISACRCSHAYAHKHVCVYLLPSCHIPSIWQVCILIRAVCLTLRWRGRAASGHQQNIMNSSWEQEETQTDSIEWGWRSTCLHKPVIGSIWIIHVFLFFFLRKTLITESGIGPPATAVSLCGRTCLIAFKGNLACFPFPLSHTVYTHSFPSKKFLLTLLLPLAFVSRWNLSSQPLLMDLSTVPVWGRRRLRVRANSFKRAPE